jgi:hypothetical protein
MWHTECAAKQGDAIDIVVEKNHPFFESLVETGS